MQDAKHHIAAVGPDPGFWRTFVDAFRRTCQDLATVCMVTHDAHYSDFVDRPITLFDGRISSP